MMGGLFPIDEAGERFVSRLAVGEIVPVDTKKPRNIRLHNKWWGMCSFMAEHSEHFPTSEHASKWMLVQLGYCTWIMHAKGDMPIADSISFANMDDETFSQMFDKACDLLCEIIPHVNDQNVRQVLAEFAGVGAMMER